MFSGTGFESGAALTFSGTPGAVKAVASTVVVTGTSVSAKIKVASGTPTGAYTVTVTNPDHTTAACSTCFSVIPDPTLSAINPSSVARGTTTAMTLTGARFAVGATVKGPSGVKFSSVTVVVSTKITATMKVSATATSGSPLPITVTNGAAGGYGAVTSALLTIT